MRPPLEVAFAIQSEGWPDGLEEVAATAIEEALRQSGARLTGVSEVSVVLLDDIAQQELNQQWRGVDAPTNVLSFPQLEPFAPLSGLIGDITLARGVLEREAAEQGVGMVDHFTHLLVHGFLHLLGHDHIDEEKALVMEQLETQILKTLGIADPYARD